MIIFQNGATNRSRCFCRPKVFGYYLVFTPLFTWLGQLAENAGVNEYIILAVTMATNLITEYLFCKLVVYRNRENTREKM